MNRQSDITSIVSKKKPTHLPECLNHLSANNERKKPTAVIAHPVINSGWRKVAPISEIYAILPSIES